jgi:hypothetical protein
MDRVRGTPMKRLSAVGVGFSAGGSALLATTLLLSVAFAGPEGRVDPNAGRVDPNGKLDQYGNPIRYVLDRGIDLPVAPVEYIDPAIPLPPIDRPEFTPPDDPRDEPPPTFYGEEIDAATNSIIYVIDNSGSMTISVEPFVDETGAIKGGNRLDRAKAELRRSITALPEAFKFNVIFFDECTMLCWGGKQDASPANKQYAISWLNGVQPDGWTNTGFATATALGDKDNKAIVLLSDGSPNFLDCAMNYVGSFDQHRELIRSNNTQNARIDCFGIGITTDPDATGFMRQVAAQNGGTYISID